MLSIIFLLKDFSCPLASHECLWNEARVKGGGWGGELACIEHLWWIRHRVGMSARVISPKMHDHPMLSCVTLAPFSSGRNADGRVDEPGLKSRLWHSLALWVQARPYPSLSLSSHQLWPFSSDRFAVRIAWANTMKEFSQMMLSKCEFLQSQGDPSFRAGLEWREGEHGDSAGKRHPRTSGRDITSLNPWRRGLL